MDIGNILMVAESFHSSIERAFDIVIVFVMGPSLKI